MEIPQYIIDRLSGEIMSKFESVYKEHLEPKIKIDSKHYLLNIADEFYKEIGNLIEVTNETVSPIAKRREATKRRWVNKELNENGKQGFNREVNEIAFYLYENSPIESFVDFYKVESLDELKLKRMKELQTWLKDENAMICQFLYLRDKRTNQIEVALTHDIQYLIVKTIKESCPKGEQSTVVSVPNSITNFPYDHTNRVKMNSNELVDGQFFQNVYFIDDKTRFETRLRVEALEEGLMRENLKMLNLLDRDILVYLMSMKHEAMYQPVPMVIEIGEIVRNIYNNDSKKSYMAVKESLIKMDYMENRIIDEQTLRSTKTEIFFSVNIEVDEVTGKEVARIIFSENLIHEFVKKQTVSIYKEIIDRFSLNSSKVLIYALQRQRILCATSTDDTKPIVFNTNLNFFRGALVFGKKRRANQIKVIESTLDEIIQNQITLKSYQRTGDNFELVFYPFSDKERIDLLNNESAEKFVSSSDYKNNDILESEQLSIL